MPMEVAALDGLGYWDDRPSLMILSIIGLLYLSSVSRDFCYSEIDQYFDF